MLLSLHFLRSFVLRDTVWFIGVTILEPTGNSVVSGGYSLVGVQIVQVIREKSQQSIYLRFVSSVRSEATHSFTSSCNIKEV